MSNPNLDIMSGQDRRMLQRREKKKKNNSAEMEPHFLLQRSLWKDVFNRVLVKQMELKFQELTHSPSKFNIYLRRKYVRASDSLKGSHAV